MRAIALVLGLVCFGRVAGAQPCPEGAYRTDVECFEATEAYALRTARHDPAPLVVSLEMLLFLGVGTAWYWIDRDRNVADWDYDSWTQRFDRDAFRMDNNEFGVNFILHAMSGAAYYGFARSADLNVAWSFATSFLTSFVWEWLLEFRERVSINDQITTPAAGVPLGEFFHKLGRFLHDTPAPTRGRRALAWLFGTPLALHRAVARRRGVDAGVPERWTARFRLGYGGRYASDGHQRGHLHAIDFDGELIDLPGHLRDGRYRRYFHDANLTRFRARGSRGRMGGGFDALAEVTLLGVEAQSIENGRGTSIVAGMGMSYLYRRQTYRGRHPGGWKDRLGIVGLPGLALDGAMLAPRGQLRWRARVNPDFAGVHASSFDAWAAGHPDDTSKSILEKQGYWYGWGGSARVELRLDVGPVTLGGGVYAGGWNSREGRDRNQAVVTNDTPGWELALDTEALLRVRFARRVFAQLDWRTQRRLGELGGIRSQRRLQEATLTVGFLR